MTASDRTTLRPRPVGLLIALVATLGVLCCGGSVSALLLSTLDDDQPQPFNANSLSCGAGALIDPNAKLPRLRDYGPSQLKNAAIIINTGRQLKVPPRGWVIAVATAMQESRLSNLGDLGARNDHDSLGLFQQRPSAGWGTPAQVRDPVYAATKFYKKLLQVPQWDSLPLTRAAQRVQLSAFPNAYAKHEAVATEIVNLLADGAARAIGNVANLVCAAGAGDIAASGWTIPWLTTAIVGGKRITASKAVIGSGFRTAERPQHQGVDLIVPRHTPIVAAAGGIVSVVKCNVDHRGTQTCDVDGWPGKGGCGWMVEIVHADRVMTRYCHMVEHPDVHVGQQVTAGQVIGHVGTSGNSSGPHLHFEVHLNDNRASSGAIDPVPFMRNQGAPLDGAQ